MSTPDAATQVLRRVESLMLETFRREPFHNLRLLYDDPQLDLLPGGTCSDKTLSFRDQARREGLEVSLHSGSIDGEEKHRLDLPPRT